MALSAKIASLFVNVVLNWQKTASGLMTLQQRIAATGKAAAGLAAIFATRMAIGSLAKLAQDAAELESKFIDIQKVLQMDDQNFAVLQSSLLSLTETLKTMPIDKLQEIALVGAQMGLRTADDINTFTEAIVKASAASESISATELARFLGKLADIYDRNVDAIQFYSNALTTLSNNLNTNEGEIIGVSERLFGITKQYGISEAALLGWSAAVRASGQMAERASTAIGLLYGKVVADPVSVAKAFGLDKASFVALALSDVDKAAGMVLAKMEKMSSLEISRTLGDMQIGGTRASQVLLALAGNQDTFNKALKDANDAMTNTIALDAKFAMDQDKLKTKITELSNAWEEFKLNLGDSKGIKDTVIVLADLVKSLDLIFIGMKKIGVIDILSDSSVIGVAKKLSDLERQIKELFEDKNAPVLAQRETRYEMERQDIKAKAEQQEKNIAAALILQNEEIAKQKKLMEKMFNFTEEDELEKALFTLSKTYEELIAAIKTSGLVGAEQDRLTQELDKAFKLKGNKLVREEEDKVAKEHFDNLMDFFERMKELEEKYEDAQMAAVEFVAGGTIVAEKIQQALNANKLIEELRASGLNEAQLEPFFAGIKETLEKKVVPDLKLQGIEEAWSAMQVQSEKEKNLSKAQLGVLRSIDLGIDELIKLGIKDPLAVVGP